MLNKNKIVFLFSIFTFCSPYTYSQNNSVPSWLNKYNLDSNSSYIIGLPQYAGCKNCFQNKISYLENLNINSKLLIILSDSNEIINANLISSFDPSLIQKSKILISNQFYYALNKSGSDMVLLYKDFKIDNLNQVNKFEETNLFAPNTINELSIFEVDSFLMPSFVHFENSIVDARVINDSVILTSNQQMNEVLLFNYKNSKLIAKLNSNKLNENVLGLYKTLYQKDIKDCKTALKLRSKIYNNSFLDNNPEFKFNKIIYAQDGNIYAFLSFTFVSIVEDTNYILKSTSLIIHLDKKSLKLKNYWVEKHVSIDKNYFIYPGLFQLKNIDTFILPVFLIEPEKGNYPFYQASYCKLQNHSINFIAYSNLKVTKEMDSVYWREFSHPYFETQINQKTYGICGTIPFAWNLNDLKNKIPLPYNPFILQKNNIQTPVLKTRYTLLRIDEFQNHNYLLLIVERNLLNFIITNNALEEKYRFELPTNQYRSIYSGIINNSIFNVLHEKTNNDKFVLYKYTLKN